MVLERLRSETRPIHDTLEQRLDLLNPNLDRERYEAVLRTFYGFYRPIEARIPAYGEGQVHWLDGNRSKVPMLASDLVLLGYDPAGMLSVPQCPVLPELRSLEQQLGCMYVLEGATLGGQLVVRHLKQMHPTGPAWPTRFFGSYGPETGRMWRTFCDRLKNAAELRPAEDEIVATACLTFECFHDWIRQNQL